MDFGEKKLLTIGIPAYKAQPHICDLLASVQIQTMKKNVSVIIANDWPEDNGTYEFVKERYPDLDITTLTCEKNSGPGLARQRALDACKTEWITFADADDVLFGPFALESIYVGATQDRNIIECQGIFYQEVQTDDPMGMRMMPRNDAGHPWVFGRLYNVKFLKENKIGFTKLRAMEDKQSLSSLNDVNTNQWCA